MTSPSAKPRVLIVDDKDSNRTAFQAVLEREFAVTLAESGEQAIELCRSQDFTVIVLDVRMPGMNGFETAEALRKGESTRTTPILIFTTAYDQHMQQVIRGYQAGATDFLFTPVEPELIKLKVATYAQIYQRHEELRLQIERLNEALCKLREELAHPGLARPWLQSKLDQVERTASEIDRHTNP